MNSAPDATGEETPEATAEAIVAVANPQGLHLRTGKEIVRLASTFTAEIRASNLSRASAPVNVKSILQLMQIQAQHGHQLRLTATGVDASEALAALATLIESLSSLDHPKPIENQRS